MNAPYTPRLKLTLALAHKIACEHAHSYTGVEHLLLAICRQKEGSASVTLARLGLTEEAARTQMGLKAPPAPPDEAARHLGEISASLQELTARIGAIQADVEILKGAKE